MNPKTFHKVSYGLYVISSVKGEQFNGQIANTVFQVTSEKPSIAICINKQNLTHEFIHESKVFTVSILPKETPMNFIGNFGFKSGREIDKFKDINFKVGKTGAPIVLDNTLGNIEAKIFESVDVETHTLYIGRVVDAEITDDKEPMTYAYYHEVKRGTAPKAAPTYIEPDAKVVNDAANYRCSICGYIYDPRIGDSESGIKPGTPFEALPESWVCPVCGAKKDKFVKQI